MTWVQVNNISGLTDYRRFQASAARVPYAVRFNSLQGKVRRRGTASADNAEAELTAEVRNTAFTAPERLEAEMTELVRFKTSTQIGRASFRERVCPYVSITVGADSLKQKKKHT